MSSRSLYVLWRFFAAIHAFGAGMPEVSTAQPQTAAFAHKNRLGFVASPAPEAQAALKRLSKRYGGVAPEKAGAVIALGGDGLMLQTLHRFMGTDVPIYGMHRGSVGFLMNEFREDDLLERVAGAKLSVIHPLKMTAENLAGERLEALAINEVHLFRQSAQSARLSIFVDGRERMNELICDGALVSTPAGSTAYNLSVGGPILPLKARLLALTPISPFRPRRWRGALLPNKAQVKINVLEPDKRPVSAVADHTEFRNVVTVSVREERGIGLKLLFDPGHALEERILAEQFRF
jgi:NAD+ kinase